MLLIKDISTIPFFSLLIPLPLLEITQERWLLVELS